MDFVAILSTGVSGFAFLMLYVGFQLTSSVQKKILDVNLQDTAPDKLKIWGRLADKQLLNTRYFMIFSVVILICGLGVLQLQFRPAVSVGLSVHPIEDDFPTVVYAHVTPIELDDNGLGSADLKSEYILTIDNKNIINELARIRMDLKAYRASEKELSETLAGQSQDAGFGSTL